MAARLVVRAAQASDLNSVLRIERASFGPDAYDRNLFAEYLRKCGGLFLVATEGDKVAGYSIACIHPGRAELVSIAVRPGRRRQGGATALMDATLRRLTRRGIARITLMVKVSNAPAISFYEGVGFRKLRRVPRYYEDGSDALLLVRE